MNKYWNWKLVYFGEMRWEYYAEYYFFFLSSGEAAFGLRQYRTRLLG